MTHWSSGLWFLVGAAAIVALAVILTGCEKTQNPTVDPKAFSFWVVPF